ncbi:MAG: hypothetical protein WCO18_00425 [bacterium]
MEKNYYSLAVHMALRLKDLESDSLTPPGEFKLPEEIQEVPIAGIDHKLRLCNESTGGPKDKQVVFADIRKLMEEFYLPFGYTLGLEESIGISRSIRIFKEGHRFPDAVGTITFDGENLLMSVNRLHGEHMIKRLPVAA